MLAYVLMAFYNKTLNCESLCSDFIKILHCRHIGDNTDPPLMFVLSFSFHDVAEEDFI